MLKTGNDKRRNREKEPHDLARHRFGRIGHPDCNTHKEIAENAADERIAERERNLCVCDGDDRSCQFPIECGKHAARVSERRDQDGAGKVAEIDDDPVAQHGAHGDAALQYAHDQKVVAGEQLASGDEHHGEARREDQAGDDLCDRRIFNRRSAGRGRDTCKRHKDTRQTRQ